MQERNWTSRKVVRRRLCQNPWKEEWTDERRENWQEMNICSYVGQKPEARGTALDSARVKCLRAHVGSEWNECHEASYLLSRHHLSRLSDKMELLKKLLCLPKSHRRARSKARGEIAPIEDQNNPSLAVLRPTESAPDLRIGTSTPPIPRPLTSRHQKPNST